MADAHSLTLGELVLTGDRAFADPEHGFWFEVHGEGTEFGDPQAVTTIVQSLLADGSPSRYDRDENRTAPVKVKVCGPTLAAVAHGEAALRRETKVSNTLTWQPPDDFAPATAFDFFPSPMSRDYQSWDLEEAMRTSRVFSLVLNCSPFARSINPVTVAAVAVPPSETRATITNADTTTGFTATGRTAAAPAGAPVTVTDQGDYAQATLSGSNPYLKMTYTPASPITMSATRYLLVECSGTSNPSFEWTIDTGRTASPSPVAVRKQPGGTTLYVFDIGGLSLVSFSVIRDLTLVTEPTSVVVNVHDISRTNMLPQTSARQLARIVEVGGTERTPGSLQVSASDGTSPLNLTLVATWPETGSGFSPPLRRWRTSGNTETVQAGSFSGKREPIGPSYVQHDIAVTSLPVGTYQLMGLLRATSAGAYTISSVIQSRLNGVTLGETTWSESVNFPIANDWALVPMGIYRIPIVAAKAGEFRIAFVSPGSTAVQYDEAWLFPMDNDCALTIVGMTTPNLWLDSPDLTDPTHRVWEGASAAKSDAHFPTNGVFTKGRHIFSAPRTAVFTATHGVDNPAVTLSYTKRWHSNAAED